MGSQRVGHNWAAEQQGKKCPGAGWEESTASIVLKGPEEVLWNVFAKVWIVVEAVLSETCKFT